MWLTNGGTANLVAVLCRTGEGHDAPHRNMTTFLIEKEPGFGPNPAVPSLTVPGKIDRMGYKGVDTTELVLSGVRVPAARVLGGRTGQGFYQMMDSVEVGRVNVAARGCGVALRAFELAVAYAQQWHAFGRPIAQHQAIAFKLAEMATKVEAAHQMMVMAARRKDSGRRNDLEAGMAKYLASEYAKEVVEDSFRIHGGYGFSKEYEIERLDPAGQSGWSVTAIGPSSEVTDSDELARLRTIGLRSWAPGEREHFIRISPIMLNGRRLCTDST